jgi:hypothetical protein
MLAIQGGEGGRDGGKEGGGANRAMSSAKSVICSPVATFDFKLFPFGVRTGK